MGQSLGIPKSLDPKPLLKEFGVSVLGFGADRVECFGIHSFGPPVPLNF